MKKFSFAQPVISVLVLCTLAIPAASKAFNNKSEQKIRHSMANNCQMPAGWPQIAQRNPRYIIFGESHGTIEAPMFVERVVCALASRGERVLVAVEHDSKENAAFQKAWNESGKRFSQQLRKSGWEGREDGVASVAMLHLINHLHTLNEKGYHISIVAFNGIRDDNQKKRLSNLPGQGPHEAAQADNILEAERKGAFDRVVILTGRLHARKVEVERGGIKFKPMAMLLSDAKNVISLSMKSSDGTSWNCRLKANTTLLTSGSIPLNAIVCGSQSYNGDADFRLPPFMSLWPYAGVENDSDYDGFFWVGMPHASKPAVRKKSI